MHRRRVTMPDGRYMYYYSFGDDGETMDTASGDASTNDAASADVAPVEPEKRDV